VGLGRLEGYSGVLTTRQSSRSRERCAGKESTNRYRASSDLDLFAGNGSGLHIDSSVTRESKNSNRGVEGR